MIDFQFFVCVFKRLELKFISQYGRYHGTKYPIRKLTAKKTMYAISEKYYNIYSVWHFQTDREREKNAEHKFDAATQVAMEI